MRKGQLTHPLDVKFAGRGVASTFWYNALMKITFLRRVIAAVGVEVEDGKVLV